MANGYIQLALLPSVENLLLV